MNITPHINHLPVATSVNPSTDNLRRENIQRPVITAPTQTSGSPAEKSTTDKEKTSGQTGEQFNFTELQKSAEKNANQVNGNTEKGNSEQNASEQHNQEGSDQNTESSNAQNSAKDDSADPNSAETTKHAQEILQLKQRDQEVRTHEQAHAATGGASTGAPSYEFKIGPDGKKYAVNGEVSVNVSPIKGDPTATIAKMERVHAAALAPVSPSGQDRRVAAQAIQLSTQAQADLVALQKEESSQTSEKESRVSSKEAEQSKESSEEQSRSFDKQMSSTLKMQDYAVSAPSNEVKERTQRIEGYYSGITQAYEKAPSHQFELTA